MGKTPAADVQLQELSLGSGISDIVREPSTGQLIVATITNNTTRIALLNTNELTLGPTMLEGSGIAVIEPDGTGRIYVAFQGTQTVVLHDLRTGETSAPFSFGTGHQVLTMRVINAAERLISVSKHRENPGFIDTTLFRDGVPLTNWVLSTIVRAVEPGGGHVYSMFGAHTKMRVDTNGLEVVTSFPMGPQGYNPDFLMDDNKLVVGTGHILSLDLEPLQTVPNAPRQSFDFNSVVFADPRTNILAFVWQRPFENSFVLYDERSGANVAELRIPMGGFAREIFPWGTNAYGLRWGDGEEGRLFLIDSQGAPRSDVSLAVESSTTAAANGTAISYTLTVRNHGPDPAESVLVHDAFTFGLAMREAQATIGSVEFGPNELFWTPGGLAVGQEAKLEIRGVATGPAFARNEATLSVAGVDPNPANNRATNTVPVAGEFTGSVRTYLLPANSMTSNPRSGDLYLSIPSQNGPFPFSVVRWKPDSNSVEAIAFYPTAPDRLALSENGEFLFVSLPLSREIEQLDLTTTSAVRFVTGMDTITGLHPLPDEPLSILLSEGGLFTPIGARVFDNGIARANIGPPGSVVPLRKGLALQFHAEALQLRELYFDEAGITAKSFSNQVIKVGVNLVGAGGRVFTENGWVIEPSTGAIVDTIPAGLNPLWAFDAEADEFYILSHDSVQWTMKRYQLSTLRKLADVAVPEPNESPNALVKWKSRGYAYKTASEIVLFSEPESAPADLALISTIVPSASGTASEPFTWVLTITNRGPNDAVNVELIAGAGGATTSTWKPADASHERYPSPFARVYPMIKAGHSERVELVITPSTPGAGGAFQLSARIERFGEDPDYDNNSTFDVYSLPPALGVIRRYGITANDMAYNKPSERLFLSVAASSSVLPSSIVSLDLNNFHLSHLFSLTNPPGVMASSDLADVGFAAVEGNLMAAQFEVEPRFFGPMFPIATQPIFEFLVQPGTTNVLAVSHWRGITLFSNGVPREVTGVIGGIAFDSEKPDKLFHYFQGTVRRFHLGAEITEEASAQLPFAEQIPMIAVNGRLFFPNGQIVDQTSLQSVGQLPDVPADSRGALIAADREANRLYLYQQFSNHDELRLFSATELAALGTISFPYTDVPVRLLAFNGRAALLAAGQLLLFDIPPTNKTDLAVSASPALALDDVPVTLSISAWNNSPWPSGPASVEVLFPSSFAFESVLGTNQFETEGQTIRFHVASFLNSETNIFRVSGRFTTPGAHVVTASITSAAEEVGPLDNRFRLPVEVIAKPLVTAATASVLEGSTFRIQFTLSHRLPQIVRPLFKMTISNGTTSVEEALNPTTNLTQTLFLNANTTNVFSTQFTARSDSISNGIRTLNIFLSEPNGVELGLSNLTLRIADDDAFPAVGNNPQGWNFIEPFTNRSSLIQLSLNRSGTSEARFDYHFRSKTALLGSDFLGEPGTIVIPAGQRIAQIPFTLLADSTIEGSETFEVELNNPQNIYIMDPVVAININENPVAPAEIVRSFIREGRMVVQFRTIPNQRYRLLRAPELTSPEWMPIGDTILDYGGSAELVDTDPTPHRQMFYRIEQKPL